MRVAGNVSDVRSHFFQVNTTENDDPVGRIYASACAAFVFASLFLQRSLYSARLIDVDSGLDKQKPFICHLIIRTSI